MRATLPPPQRPTNGAADPAYDGGSEGDDQGAHAPGVKSTAGTSEGSRDTPTGEAAGSYSARVFYS